MKNTLTTSRRLLSPEEYEQIIREGRAAEALMKFVRNRAGRKKSITITRAEYQRRWRQRVKQAHNDQLSTNNSNGENK